MHDKPAITATRRTAASLLLPYLALVAIHLFAGLQMEQPLILADEVGYLGNARYLAGAADLPDMQGSQFYHFGYSLFLLPAFWLFTDPGSIYQAALAINALLISALLFPLYWILTSFARLPAAAARWIGFACCLYPSLLLYSNFAWAENAFVPLYATAVALFGRYLTSRSIRDALLFSLVASALYTVHPRALPILAVILVYLLLLAVLRAIPLVHLLLSGAAMATVLGVTRLVNHHLKAIAWAGSGEVSAAKLAGRLVPGDDFVALLERAAGQLLYLALSSHGLFLVGLVVMIGLVVKALASRPLGRVLGEPGTGVPIFILTTATAVFLTACTLKLYALHGPRGLRGAEFIHGRYNEAFGVLAIAFAAADLWRRRLDWRQLVLRVLVVSAAILCLASVVMIEVEDALVRQVAGKPGVEASDRVPPADVDAVAVPGVFPLVYLVGGLKLYPVSLAVLASFALITVLSRFSRRGALLLLMALFGFFSYYNHRQYLQPLVAKARPRLAFVSEVRSLGAVAEIAYDAAHREPGFLPAVQFLLQDRVFVRFDSRNGDPPGSEVVIAGSQWPSAGALGARFVTSSGRGSALWVLPGALQTTLPSVGYEGQRLGAERRPDLQEAGFYRQEVFDGAPGRWTNGAAMLSVPLDPRRPPRWLEVETLAPGPDRPHLQILANGVELWNRPIPHHRWRKRFLLTRVRRGRALVVELKSNTFSPAGRQPSSGDRRRLGIVVLGIRLLDARLLDDAGTAEPAGPGDRGE